jgi:hypothetical protein
VLRGVIEAYRYAVDEAMLDCASRLAEALLRVQDRLGRLAGRWSAEWEAREDSACLTGISQIAACWFLLSDILTDDRYKRAALLANSYVRRTVKTHGANGVIGGVAGSFPIDGGYAPFEYLSWAVKFALDANLMELDSRAGRILGAATHESRSQP